MLITRRDRHVASFVGQCAGDGLADAAASAGDERALSFELQVHQLPPLPIDAGFAVRFVALC